MSHPRFGEPSGQGRPSYGGLPPLPPELDPRGRRAAGHRRARGRRGGWAATKFLAAVLATLLSVGLLGMFGTYWWKFHQFKSGLNRVSISATSKGGGHDVDGKDQNILVVGNDDRSTATDAELAELGTGRDGGSLATDTMMIIHVPADGSKATLISLPRDSYVNIPGHGMNKLNAAYANAFTAAGGDHRAKQAAGANLLVQTVHDLTGLRIDHYVQVDLLGFYRISKAVGGIRVNMCAAVQEPLSGINLHAGINVIEGKQALAFVRQRHGFPNGLGDLDRVQRQQYFLTAAFRKLASAGTLLNPLKLQGLLSAVQSSIYIDDTLDPLQLGRQLEHLTADNIVGKTIPTDGFANTDVGSVVVVHPAEVKAFVSRLIGTSDTALDAAKPIAPSQVRLNVLNAGSGIDGAAHTNAEQLKAQGFQLGQVGDAPQPSAVTTIQYADGMQAQAKTLAQYVPGAALQKADVATLTLLLGADGLGFKPKPSAPPPSSGSSSPAGGSTPPTSAPKPAPIDAGCIY